MRRWDAEELQHERIREKLAQPELYLADPLDKLLFMHGGHRTLQLFPVLRHLMDRARRSGRRSGQCQLLRSAALAVFLLPTAMLLLVKFLALWLIGQSQVLSGTLVVLLAKLMGTALVARMFTLTQPALMQLAWFARLYTRWLDCKEALLTQVRVSWLWRLWRLWRLGRLGRLGRVMKHHLRQRWRRFMASA